MDYLHQHAGYTRVHNPLTGKKDLQRLPGLAAIAYQHETSRCGDPHLHTHVILPNRQARADGELVSIDSKSLYHEAKAAGIVYQAVLRHELHAERGFEWDAVGEHSGMAEIAGITKECIKAWSQRSTRLREWAREQPGRRRRRTDRRADCRPRRRRRGPPSRNRWRGRSSRSSGAPTRAAWNSTAPRTSRRARRAAPRARTRAVIARALRAMAARIDKAAFTRADLVELVGAQLPVDAPATRARSSSRSSTSSRCASPRRAKRTTAKATSCSPWTR